MKSNTKGTVTGAAALALVFAGGIGVAVADEAGTQSGYDGGFYINHTTEEGQSFALTIQGRVQTRYTFETVDAGEERDNDSAFDVNRARLTLKGHAFTEAIDYKFQTDFPAGDPAELKDFYVDYNPSGDIRVRAGQYKRPFSRQQITSSGRQEFVDRAITNGAFDAGRDMGVMVHNNYEKSPELEWAVGLFNGTGDSIVPDTFNPSLVARVGYNMGGIKGYSEADLEGGPLRFGVAASALSQLDVDGGDEDGDPTDGGDADNGAVRAEVDFIVKAEGVSATGGVYFSTLQDDVDFADQATEAFGAHAQVGYTIDKLHHVAARYAIVSYDDDTVGDDQEITAVYSLFRFAHGFKWQTEVSLLTTGEQSVGDDIRVRSQLQLSF